MSNLPESAILLVDSHHGIYVPQIFAQLEFNHPLEGVSAEDIEILSSGPDSEYYLDTWEAVGSNAVITSDEGTRYRLHQDEDLWLIPEDYEWPDEW